MEQITSPPSRMLVIYMKCKAQEGLCGVKTALARYTRSTQKINQSINDKSKTTCANGQTNPGPQHKGPDHKATQPMVDLPTHKLRLVATVCTPRGTTKLTPGTQKLLHFHRIWVVGRQQDQTLVERDNNKNLQYDYGTASHIVLWPCGLLEQLQDSHTTQRGGNQTASPFALPDPAIQGWNLYHRCNHQPLTPAMLLSLLLQQAREVSPTLGHSTHHGQQNHCLIHAQLYP